MAKLSTEEILKWVKDSETLDSELDKVYDAIWQEMYERYALGAMADNKDAEKEGGHVLHEARIPYKQTETCN